jgi:hypothetical protein
MALIELKVDPSRRELCLFGMVLLPAFLALVGAMIWMASGSSRTAIAIWSIGLCVSVIGMMYLPFMRLVYVTWMYAAYPIGWTVSHLMFASVYYLILTPLGLLLRVVRKDQLERRFEPSIRSYWVPRKQIEDVDQYFRQY